MSESLALTVAGRREQAGVGVERQSERDLELTVARAPNGEELRNAMLQKYPDLAVRGLLAYSAQTAYRQ